MTPIAPWIRLALAALVLPLVAACSDLHAAKPSTWYAAHGGVAPRDIGRVVVCHGFGCYYKTTFTFGDADLRQMAALIGSGSAAEERAGVARMIAWAETRVAATVGSQDDVGGLDLKNARVAGQMDCIDEATNTTSYMMVAQKAGLLKHHTVGSPVARGYFLDGRYPHATAVLIGSDEPWAVDSWPSPNGAEPDILRLDAWFAKSPAT
ncbi:hypothetical protein [Acuticoccus yangtzensis]|uniref:hypothetical protein n=1 Tax=Acuticoccus yangtzensis TaxID=1443441 RepID=UPI000A534B89|nr:hypothetical protein [Acuticoccus yangtzensis]